MAERDSLPPEVLRIIFLFLPFPDPASAGHETDGKGGKITQPLQSADTFPQGMRPFPQVKDRG